MTKTSNSQSSVGPVFDSECDRDAAEQDINALYSEEFQTLLRVDALSGVRSFHPVYVLGYGADMIRKMRDSYRDEDESTLEREHPIYTVKMYGVFENADLANRIGIPPSVIVLAPHVDIEGDVRAFVQMHRVPVLRVQLVKQKLADIPRRDYYGGRVYETLEESDIGNRLAWTRAINIGLLIWLRDRGDLRNETTLVSLRDTKAIRKQFTATPASSFSAFASEQLRGHGLDTEAAQSEHVRNLPPESVFSFTHDSDHEDAQIATYLETRKGTQDTQEPPHPLFG